MKYLVLILSLIGTSAFGMSVDQINAMENRANRAATIATVTTYALATAPTPMTVAIPIVAAPLITFTPLLVAAVTGLGVYSVWKVGETLYGRYTKPANAEQ